jgi:predicted secreted protein
MRPSGVLAASARRAAELFVALVLLASPALAGDRALIEFLGYSPDGKYFAFEQFGIQDGSGFAYSEIQVIDLVADKWTYGSPFLVRATEDNPDRPLDEVRAEARQKAKDKLDEVKIGEPVEMLALIGDGVPSDDGRTLLFSVPSCCGPGQTQDDRLTLTLSSFPAGSTADCESILGHKAMGYALTLGDGSKTIELHRDGASIPRTRGCVMDYRLYGVIAPLSGQGPRLAIISVYPFGFEGPDRRFLVTPIDRP